MAYLDTLRPAPVTDFITYKVAVKRLRRSFCFECVDFALLDYCVTNQVSFNGPADLLPSTATREIAKAIRASQEEEDGACPCCDRQCGCGGYCR